MRSHLWQQQGVPIYEPSSCSTKGDRDETPGDRGHTRHGPVGCGAGLGADVGRPEPSGAQPALDGGASTTDAGPTRVNYHGTAALPGAGLPGARRRDAAALRGAGLSLLSVPIPRLRLFISVFLRLLVPVLPGGPVL